MWSVENDIDGKVLEYSFKPPKSKNLEKQFVVQECCTEMRGRFDFSELSNLLIKIENAELSGVGTKKYQILCNLIDNEMKYLHYLDCPSLKRSSQPQTTNWNADLPETTIPTKGATSMFRAQCKTVWCGSCKVQHLKLSNYDGNSFVPIHFIVSFKLNQKFSYDFLLANWAYPLEMQNLKLFPRQTVVDDNSKVRSCGLVCSKIVRDVWVFVSSCFYSNFFSVAFGDLVFQIFVENKIFGYISVSPILWPIQFLRTVFSLKHWLDRSRRDLLEPI